MSEITIGYLDEATGSLLLDDELPLAAEASNDLIDVLGAPEGVGCARPQAMTVPPAVETQGPTARISGYWHNDFMVGPGRRSVVRFQGCPIRCAGCWVPETHDPNAGVSMNVAALADALLSEPSEGVTILGGEPFAQPEALHKLLVALFWQSQKRATHVTVYTGFTREALQARGDWHIASALNMIDVLIDGPYVQGRAHTADCGCDDEVRRYTGSCNQRVRRLR